MSDRFRYFTFTVLSLSLAVPSRAQWTKLNAPTADRVAALGTQGTNLFVGTFNGRLIRSEDLGATWEFVDSGLALPRISAFAAMGSQLFESSYGGGILVSGDSGHTWRKADSTLPAQNVYCMMVKGDTIFAGTNLGVFCSADSGVAWHDANGGSISYPIGALAYTESTILAGGLHEVLLSTNSGGSWVRPDSNVMTNSSPMAFLVSGGDIFCTTFLRGVFRSSDDGWTWVRADSGITCDVTVSIVEARGSLFVGTHVGGVCRSADRGQHWVPINEGLSQVPSAFSLAVLDSFLFAATDSGVYRRPLSEISTSVHGNASWPKPLEFQLDQNYPNPFNPRTTIRYKLPHASRVSMKVYNTLGQEVATLVNETKPAGVYTVQFDAANLASGVYFYRLRADNYTKTKTLILLR